jgi:hypothetical protein
VTDPTTNGKHSGPTASEISGLVSAERTAGEYVPVPRLADAAADQPTSTEPRVADKSDASNTDESATLEHGSGNAALAAAAERARITGGRNIADVPPLPIPPDTANVRSGPEVHPACLSLLPLIGVWRGTGLFGNDPDLKTPQFGQQITIAHDGRPFLTYESVSWLLAPDGSVTGPGTREVGFWRPQQDGSIELMVAHAEGRIELFYGRPRSVASWALSTDAVVRTPTAVPVVGSTRLYGITPDGRLAYVEERAHSDIELAPHASAALERLAG